MDANLTSLNICQIDWTIMESTKSGLYFTDGLRKIDYVIVVNKRKLPKLEFYIKNLKELGLQTEIKKGQQTPSLFLLIHIPDRPLKHFAKVHDVASAFSTTNFNAEDSNSQHNRELTSTERIMIAHKLLNSTKYGYDDTQVTIQKMERKEMIIAAYPLHDGLSAEGDEPNDYELLKDYWSFPGTFFKTRPLDLINRYFGNEVAFYFAWVEFFNFFLLPMALMGIVVVLINIYYILYTTLIPLRDVCEGKKIFMCPVCEDGPDCHFKSLAEECRTSKFCYVFDNYLTVLCALLMSFWATIFVHMWQRRSNTLKFKWNIRYEEPSPIRPGFYERATDQRFSYATGKMEPCESTIKICFSIAISFAVCIFMILLTVMFLLLLLFLKSKIGYLFLKWKFTKQAAPMLKIVLGSIMQLILLKLYAKLFYNKISLWLTENENPRTQRDYDKSVLYKSFFLAFINNYTICFYTAWIKGRFYYYPDHYNTPFIGLFQKDTCHPFTCVLNLGSLLMIILLLKKFIKNVLLIIKPFLKITSHKIMQRATLPGYEEQYYLIPSIKYMYTQKFSERIIEYGYITFFSSVFPLAPICVLINNVLELRVEAYRLTFLHRRPIPTRTTGIGCWDGILGTVTFISTAVNAFVLVFTTDFMTRHGYRMRHKWNLEGFIMSTLSEFSTKDYSPYTKVQDAPEKCYYRGMRYPPSAPSDLKYTLIDEHWVDVDYKLIFVLIFEHLLFILNRILHYCIRTEPKSIEEFYCLEERKLQGEEMPKFSEEDQEMVLLGPVLYPMQETSRQSEYVGTSAVI